MTYDQWTGIIREFGFPVFVVVWFMFRMERRVDRLIELLAALIKAIAVIARSLDDHRADIRAQTTPIPQITPKDIEESKEGAPM